MYEDDGSDDSYDYEQHFRHTDRYYKSARNYSAMTKPTKESYNTNLRGTVQSPNMKDYSTKFTYQNSIQNSLKESTIGGKQDRLNLSKPLKQINESKKMKNFKEESSQGTLSPANSNVVKFNTLEGEEYSNYAQNTGKKPLHTHHENEKIDEEREFFEQQI